MTFERENLFRFKHKSMQSSQYPLSKHDEFIRSIEDDLKPIVLKGWVSTSRFKVTHTGTICYKQRDDQESISNVIVTFSNKGNSWGNVDGYRDDRRA